MYTRLNGKCTKRISRMSRIVDWGNDEDNQKHLVELSVEVGDHISFNGPYIYGDDTDEYYFFLGIDKYVMSRAELEDHFEVVWEHGCYNTCIRDGIPCKMLGRIAEGATDRTRYDSNCCRIGWEVGRGDCYRYETKSVI